MQIIPWKGDKKPDAGFVGDEFRKLGYAVSARPLANNEQTPMLNSLAGDQVLWLVRGSIDLTIGEKVLVLKAGDRVEIPKGNKYHVKAKVAEGSFYLLGQKL